MVEPLSAGGTPGTGAPGVLVCDAEPLYADGLRAALDAAPDLRWHGWVPRAEQARTAQQRLRSPIVCLDARLDPVLSVAADLVATPGCRVVLLVPPTAPGQSGLLTRAGYVGVHAGLPRGLTGRQAMTGIRATIRHGRYWHPALTDTTHRREVSTPTARALSRREFDVLLAMAVGEDNTAIARRLFISRETVRTHVKGVLRKLEVHDRAHAIARAYDHGLLVPGGPDPAPGAGGAGESTVTASAAVPHTRPPDAPHPTATSTPPEKVFPSHDAH